MSYTFHSEGYHYLVCVYQAKVEQNKQDNVYTARYVAIQNLEIFYAHLYSKFYTSIVFLYFLCVCVLWK